MTTVPDDYDPPETTPQIGALRAYVERREHADHETFSMGREFAEALLGEYDRLLYLAEVKYELLRSERGYDLHEELDGRLRKLYMNLNAESRGDTENLDGEEITPETKWNNLVELSVTAAVHWLANARWAVIEHRDADRLRAAIVEARAILGDAFGHADAPYTPAALSALAVLTDVDVEPPEKPDGAITGGQS